jgi:hypothetical protein
MDFDPKAARSLCLLDYLRINGAKTPWQPVGLSSFHRKTKTSIRHQQRAVLSAHLSVEAQACLVDVTPAKVSQALAAG